VTPSSALNPPDAPPDFEREFNGAVIALSREPGFRLNAALFRSRAVRDRTHERLRIALAQVNVLLTTLDLRQKPTHFLLRELEQHLTAQPTPEGQRRAIAVLGLEDQLGLAIAGLPGGDEERAILHNANLHRDAFPRLCPCPLLLWVTDGAFHELIRQAPDLWHWRAHTFQFTEAGEDTSQTAGQGTQSIQDTGKPLPYRDYHEREDALKLFQETLRHHEAAGQGQTLEACEVRDRIGNILYSLARYADAERILLQNLAILAQILGNEHPNTLGSLNNLANLALDRGDLAEAETLYRRALAGQERTLGLGHADTLKSRNNLAILLAHKGDLVGAEPLFRGALEEWERTLGPEAPQSLSSLNNLATLLSDKGDLAGAEPLSRRALLAYERTLGPEHPNTLQSLNSLASLLSKKGDLAGAEPLYRRALEVRERTLGPEHPATMASLNNLANLFSRKGDVAGAEPLYRRTLAVRERTLGLEHPDTLASLNNLADLLRVLGKWQEGELLAERAVSGYLAKLGPEHPNTKTAQRVLAALREMRAAQTGGK